MLRNIILVQQTHILNMLFSICPLIGSSDCCKFNWPVRPPDSNKVKILSCKLALVFEDYEIPANTNSSSKAAWIKYRLPIYISIGTFSTRACPGLVENLHVGLLLPEPSKVQDDTQCFPSLLVLQTKVAVNRQVFILVNTWEYRIFVISTTFSLWSNVSTLLEW